MIFCSMECLLRNTGWRRSFRSVHEGHNLTAAPSRGSSFVRSRNREVARAKLLRRDALTVGVEAMQMRAARRQEDGRAERIIRFAVEPHRHGADLRHVDIQERVGAKMLDVRDLALPMTNLTIGLDMLRANADGVRFERLRFRPLHEVHLRRAD